MGRSKGFGFVEMDTDAQAQAAIQGLHDHEHDGRRLTVTEAKPREARTRRRSVVQWFDRSPSIVPDSSERPRLFDGISSVRHRRIPP